MYKEINLVITENSYLKSLESFEVIKLKQDYAKVVQMKWSNNLEEDDLRKNIYKLYMKEVGCIGKARGHTLESRKEALVAWVERIRRKYPELFNDIGWWDLKVGKTGD
jgi:hypothetical protein